MVQTWGEALELIDMFATNGRLTFPGVVERALRENFGSIESRLEVFRGTNEERIYERLKAYDVRPGEQQHQQQPAVQDHSSSLIRHLLETQILLPTSRSELNAALESATTHKLPMSPEVYSVVKAQNQLLAEHNLVATDGSILPSTLGTVVMQAPKAATTEMTVSLYVSGGMQHVCDMMEQYSELKIKLKVTNNAVEGDTSSKAIGKGFRPDTLWAGSNCTVLVAEDKKRKLREAVKDLRRKRLKLSKMHYGELRFLVGYAAAEGRFQLYWLGVELEDVQAVGDELNLSLLADRVKWVQYIVMVYRLADLMASVAPNLVEWAMFEEIPRVTPGTHMVVLDDGIRKTIKSFEGYCTEYRTSLDVMTRAYAAATAAASAAAANGSPVNLNHAKEAPTVSRSGKYSVRTCPLGYTRVPKSVKDVKAIARAACGATAILHAVGITHRDLRFPNLVCNLAPPGNGAEIDPTYMVVDLEGAGLDGTIIPEDFKLELCNAPGVLDDGRIYTTRSDMFEVGLLVEGLLRDVDGYLGAAVEFVTALKGKGLTALDALQHSWLN